MPTTASTSAPELTDGAAAHAAPEPAGFPRHRARAVQPGRPVGFGVVLAVLAGTAAALQTRIHGELGARIDDGALTAIISFGGGLLILLTMLIGSPAMRRGAHSIRAAVRTRQLPVWLLFGGLAGALTVFSQAMTASAARRPASSARPLGDSSPPPTQRSCYWPANTENSRQVPAGCRACQSQRASASANSRRPTAWTVKQQVTPLQPPA